MFLRKTIFHLIEFEFETFASVNDALIYNDVLKYAEYLSELEDYCSFTISEYDSEEDYYNNI